LTRSQDVDARRTVLPRGRLRELLTFAAVGAACTAVYAGCFVLAVGVMNGQLANAAATLVAAGANTAANRRYTFGLRGPVGAARHHARGLVVFLAGLAITASALWALKAAEPSASGATQVATLVAATLGASIVRYLLMRSWVFASETRALPDS
jgi:putative flippase GtrA